MNLHGYTLLLLQGIIISSLYIYASNDYYKKETHLTFAKLVLFYIIIQDVARMMAVDNTIVILTFLSKIVSIYIDA
jgi:hypothetical protein